MPSARTYFSMGAAVDYQPTGVQCRSGAGKLRLEAGELANLSLLGDLVYSFSSLLTVLVKVRPSFRSHCL